MLIVFNSRKHFEVLLLLLFFEGLFDAFTDLAIGKFTRDVYRVFIFLYPLLLFLWYYSKGFMKTKVDIIFLLISLIYIVFLTTGENTVSYFMTQYHRVMILYLLFRFWNLEIKYFNNTLRIQNFFESLILVQIIFTFFKLLIFGIQEGIVGSIQYPGDIATFLPVLTLILVWQKYYPHFSLKKLTKRDWFLVIGVLVIAIASYKRAIWGLYPLTIIALIYYVPYGIAVFKKLLLIIPVIIIFILIGININSTFTQQRGLENETRFENKNTVKISQAIEYVKYYYGISSIQLVTEIGISTPSFGRFDGMINVLNRIRNNPLDKYVLLGHGVNESLGGTSNENFDHEKHQVRRWSAGTSRAHRYFIAFGYVGMLAYYLFVIYLISYVKDRRFRLILILFFSFDYFLYYSTMTTYSAMASIFAYIINKNRN